MLLAFAPLIRGGNRRVALILLEALALVLLLAIGAKMLPSATRQRRISVPVLLLALSPLWVAIVQLTPLPSAVWASLPGHDVYVQALTAVQLPVEGWRPLSLVPDATWLSVLAGLPLAAAFLLAQIMSERQLAVLVRAVVLFTVPQAILGLLQVSLARQLYFDAVAYGRAIGSFANPNHLASYIVMTLPLTILVLRQAMQRGALHRDDRNVGVEGVGRSVYPAIWGAVLFLQLAALLASLSRAGMGVGFFIALAATLMLPLQELSRRALGWRVAGAVALCVLVVASVGIEGLLARIGESANEGSRWLMMGGTWQAALTFWPFGSGLGSYAGVFPRFQPPGLSGYADFAHSDFLQLLMECGLLFVVFAAIAVRLIAMRVQAVARRLRADPSDRVGVLQASCGLGLLAVILHSWVDFNLHIPANAVLACFLMGVFLRPMAGDEARGRFAAAS